MSFAYTCFVNRAVINNSVVVNARGSERKALTPVCLLLEQKRQSKTKTINLMLKAYKSINIYCLKAISRIVASASRSNAKLALRKCLVATWGVETSDYRRAFNSALK